MDERTARRHRMRRACDFFGARPHATDGEGRDGGRRADAAGVRAAGVVASGDGQCVRQAGWAARVVRHGERPILDRRVARDAFIG